MRTLGRLLRLSLTATAIADVAAGLVLGAGSWPAGPGPWLLIAASLCVYHGGMALNDWADRAHDAATRSDRPLPSGAIAPGVALGLALGLLVLGPALGFLADARAGAVLALAAVLAATYDLAPRHPWSGPALLGLCRALNLSAGIVYGLGQGAWSPTLGFPVTYGLYVFVVSRLGRLEDREDELASRRLHPRWLVATAAALLVAPLALAISTGGREASNLALLLTLAVTVAGSFDLFRLAANERDWSPANIGRAMGMALRRLLIFTSATALATGGRDGLVVGLVILAGYPVSHALRKVFPPS